MVQLVNEMYGHTPSLDCFFFLNYHFPKKKMLVRCCRGQLELVGSKNKHFCSSSTFHVLFTPFHIKWKQWWKSHCTLEGMTRCPKWCLLSQVAFEQHLRLTFSEGSFRALRSSSSSSRIFNGLLGPFFPFESLLLSEFCQEKQKWLFSVVPSCLDTW